MHSTRSPSRWLTFHHNGDFSGSVKFEVPVAPDESWTGDGDRITASQPYRQTITQRQVVEVEVPFEDLKYLVLQQIRLKAIAFLETADDATLEKFFTGWSEEAG